MQLHKILVYIFFALCAVLCFTPLWISSQNRLYDFCLKTKTALKPVQQSEQIKQLDLGAGEHLVLDRYSGDRLFFTRQINELDAKAVFYVPELLSEIPQHSQGRVFASISNRHFPILIKPVPQEKARFYALFNSPSETVFLNSILLHPQFTKECHVPEVEYFDFPKAAFPGESINLSRNTTAAVLGQYTDSDGKTRKLPLLYRYSDGFLPSASLYASLDFYNADLHSITVKPGKYLSFNSINGQKISIPVDKDCCIYIPFAGKRQNEENRIYLETVEKSHETHSLNSKYLFISDITPSADNLTATPFESAYSKTGCEVWALNSIITKNFIRECPLYLKLIFLFVLISIVELNFYIKPMWLKNLFYVLYLCALILVQGLLWIYRGIIPFFWPLLFTAAVTWLVQFFCENFTFKTPQTVLESEFPAQEN